jgi:hypothetical protein
MPGCRRCAWSRRPGQRLGACQSRPSWCGANGPSRLGLCGKTAAISAKIASSHPRGVGIPHRLRRPSPDWLAGAPILTVVGTMVSPQKIATWCNGNRADGVDLMHQINARGTFMVSKFAVPFLEKSDNPHILNSAEASDSSCWISSRRAWRARRRRSERSRRRTDPRHRQTRMLAAIDRAPSWG